MSRKKRTINSRNKRSEKSVKGAEAPKRERENQRNNDVIYL